jgi:hypothetical protein|tara:strand:+ start:620 stop:808 length:189 start_codon:yes stop_codon:yes gene_type:complete
MKKEIDIYKLIEDMERDMLELYATNGILKILKQDERYVEVSLAAVMSDKEHYRALGLIVGEA